MSGIPGYLDPVPTKIVCVGKNYADHARELGSELPAEPLIFLKPVSTLIGHGEAIELPPGAGRVDFEGEVAVQIGRRATRVPEGEALGYVSAVLPLNDVTARDLQNRDGQWTRAKGFDTFCPVGEPVPAGTVDLEGLRVRTTLNGEVKQDALLAEAVFQVPALIAWISRIMTLEPGDIIATGTPSGIGPIVPWDEVEVTVEGVGAVRNPVRPAPGEPWPYGFPKG
jgi:2-keto-4-pentenoate hydratase/2-oxohepta-3-ene-1,7-dioic acid hydratase in catechol pathway